MINADFGFTKCAMCTVCIYVCVHLYIYAHVFAPGACTPIQPASHSNESEFVLPFVVFCSKNVSNKKGGSHRTMHSAFCIQRERKRKRERKVAVGTEQNVRPSMKVKASSPNTSALLTNKSLFSNRFE